MGKNNIKRKCYLKTYRLTRGTDLRVSAHVSHVHEGGQGLGLGVGGVALLAPGGLGQGVLGLDAGPLRPRPPGLGVH